MGMFSKKQPDADEFLPLLTSKQGNKLRRLALDALLQTGMRGEDKGDYILAQGNYEFGLENLARRVLPVPEDFWREITEQHMDQLVNSVLNQREPSNTGNALLVESYIKVAAPHVAESMKQSAGYSYLKELCSLSLAIVFDGGGSIRYASDDELAGFGPEKVWEAATSNFFDLGPGTPERISKDSSSILVIDSGSIFQATWLAHPAELFERLGISVSPSGAILSAPTNSTLCLHVIDDGSSAKDFSFLLETTLRQFDRDSQPLSPHLFWWDGSNLVQLSELIEDENGQSVRFTMPPTLADAPPDA